VPWSRGKFGADRPLIVLSTIEIAAECPAIVAELSSAAAGGNIAAACRGVAAALAALWPPWPLGGVLGAGPAPAAELELATDAAVAALAARDADGGGDDGVVACAAMTAQDNTDVGYCACPESQVDLRASAPLGCVPGRCLCHAAVGYFPFMENATGREARLGRRVVRPGLAVAAGARLAGGDGHGVSEDCFETLLLILCDSLGRDRVAFFFN
jgi:hypothetical protein